MTLRNVLRNKNDDDDDDGDHDDDMSQNASLVTNYAML